MTSYYDRPAIRLVDGTLSFKSAEDDRNEREVAAILTNYFSKQHGACTFCSFGRLSPIDWYIERDARVIGVAELKARNHASGTYPTVFLNVRKWVALTMASLGLGVPALFAARFTDGVFFIWLGKVDARQHSISGCFQARAVKSENDVEPLIEVPIEHMERVPL